ncbi:hypothetical protein ACU4HD_44715 (plasmid) [Cupriavidus basilensis]
MGYNGSGKTQLAGAMLATIVGRPAISVKEDGVGPSEVELVMEEGSQVEVAELLVARDGEGRVAVSKTTRPMSLQALSAMSEPEGQKLLVRLGQRDLDGLHIDDVERAIPRRIVDDPLWARIRESGG